MKTTIEDEKVKDKISEEDRNKITQKCDEAIKWLDANQLAEVKKFIFYVGNGRGGRTMCKVTLSFEGKLVKSRYRN
jgi:hypothetical protein